MDLLVARAESNNCDAMEMFEWKLLLDQRRQNWLPKLWPELIFDGFYQKQATHLLAQGHFK